MPLKEPKYKPNQTIIKVIGYEAHRKIQVTTCAFLRTKGIEDEFKCLPSPKGSINDEKLSRNISRARTKIFELAYSNHWQWFVTLTLDPSKYNRADLDKFHKDLVLWLRYQSQKLGSKIDFLIVPEKHSDGESWHMHGLFRGIPVEVLHQLRIGQDKMSSYQAKKIRAGTPTYIWLDYQKKFGFCDIERIGSEEAVSKYITKYVTKALASSVSEVGGHLYYRSRGLNEAEIIKTGTMSSSAIENIIPDYQTEFVAVTTYDYSEELLESLTNSVL